MTGLNFKAQPSQLNFCRETVHSLPTCGFTVLRLAHTHNTPTSQVTIDSESDHASGWLTYVFALLVLLPLCYVTVMFHADLHSRI